MKEARENLSWSPHANKVMVMIGDATPHTPNQYGVRFKENDAIDWKEEVNKLLQSVSLKCFSFNIFAFTQEQLWFMEYFNQKFWTHLQWI